MPRLGFAIDNRACIGCHACTVACKAEHNVPLGVNRTWVKYIEKGEFPQTRRFFNVQRCNHCADAPCVEICPVTSLYTRPDGVVDFDSSRCIGCKACMQACPYDALYLDPATLTAAKCNYCTHRIEAGYEPACVVVCPVEAIVSGDLDDPESRIAKLAATQRVQYPKLEKGTNPKLFYVGGDSAALDPAAAPPGQNYLWSGNDGRISLPQLRRADDEAQRESLARRTYDPNTKPMPWGWMVSAYVTTKAIAAGVAMIAVVLFALGRISSVMPVDALLISLSFLAATGALLVGDLKQPQRFLYVLLRPQWRSWLVRGAYIITAFGAVLTVSGLAAGLGVSRGAQLALGWVVFALAMAVAGYTALLFAQAKGRDYWQNPVLLVTMVADAGACGVVVASLLGWLGDDANAALVVTTGVLGLLLAAEHLPRHANRNAERAAKLMTHGALSPLFWLGAVDVGIVLPASVALAGGPLVATAVLIVAGIAIKNHLIVQAPQHVPLS